MLPLILPHTGVACRIRPGSAGFPSNCESSRPSWMSFIAVAYLIDGCFREGQNRYGRRALAYGKCERKLSELIYANVFPWALGGESTSLASLSLCFHFLSFVCSEHPVCLLKGSQGVHHLHQSTCDNDSSLPQADPNVGQTISTELSVDISRS